MEDKENTEVKEVLDPQYKWLNKQQVGEILGKSDKGVQRLTASGALIVTYIKEAGFQRAYYRADDVEYFKEHGHTPKPITVEVEGNTTPNTVDTVATKDKKALVQGKLNPEKIMASLIAGVLDQAQKRGLLALSSATSNVKQKPVVPIADKMMLTIAEAAALSGHPEAELRKAHAAGKLHGVKLGKGLKVRREDLKLYIDGLFAKF